MKRGLVVSLVALTCGCAPRPDRPDSLLLVVIDTLRADRLGFSGYSLASTPTLDSLAAHGVVFRQANTTAPLTLPAVASLLTGRYPIAHGVRSNGFFTLGPEVETLAERFRGRGFRTAAVVGSAVLANDRGLDRGFDTYDAEFGEPYPVYDPSLRYLAHRIASDRRRADRVTDRAIELLIEMASSPWLLLVHYFDVHNYYDPPPEFARLHPGRPYDGEVSFVDREIGRLLDALPDPERTLVVVVADHGESQGQHGEPQHGFLVYQSTMHVPLVVSGPGVPSGEERDDPVSLVDLEPTLAHTFDLSGDGEPRDGRILDWKRVDSEPVPLYGESFSGFVSHGWSELRSVRLGDWKLVHGPTDELFNLRDDPDEVRDLGSREPAPRLLAILEEMAAGDDPEVAYREAHGGTESQPRDLLESLGYVASADGAQSAPAVRPHPRDELPRWVARQEAKFIFRQAVPLAKGHEFERARALLDSVLAIDPNLADAYVLRGYCREGLGEVATARSDYVRAVDLDPDNVPGRTALARLAELAGRPGEAAEHWGWVLQKLPDDLTALRFLSRFHEDDEEKALPYLRRLDELSRERETPESGR